MYIPKHTDSQYFTIFQEYEGKLTSWSDKSHSLCFQEPFLAREDSYLYGKNKMLLKKNKGV